MPMNSLTAKNWIVIFYRIADAVEASKDRLNRLDSAIGDGDHGVSMSIGFRAVRAGLPALSDEGTVDQVFNSVGRTFMSAAGGAIGPLIGTMWMDAGKALSGCSAVGEAECVRMLEAMESAVVRRGKAQPGDKTILDALHPAVVAAIEVRDQDLATILRRAAEAAGAGAESTVSMMARMGRSSRLGERTLGHQDAGATSLALILRVIHEAVQKDR